MLIFILLILICAVVGPHVHAVKPQQEGKQLPLLPPSCGDSEIEHQILENQINDITRTVPGREFPLHAAIKLNYYEAAEYYLKEKANPNAFDHEGVLPPLYYAFYRGNTRFIELLLSFGAYADMQVKVFDEIDVNGKLCTTTVGRTRTIAEKAILDLLRKESREESHETIRQIAPFLKDHSIVIDSKIYNKVLSICPNLLVASKSENKQEDDGLWDYTNKKIETRKSRHSAHTLKKKTFSF
jgi:hypothetical protein